MNVFWEIFGYFGTFLVFASMMMTSVKKLRLLNIAGSVICAVYAATTSSWPVVLLNAGLALINVVQLFRLHRQRDVCCVEDGEQTKKEL